MTRDKKLTSLTRKKSFLKKAPILELVTRSGRIEIRRNLNSKTIWTLTMWTVFYLMAYDDPRYRQRKSLAKYANSTVPLLKRAKREGAFVPDDLPAQALSRREDQVMHLYYLMSLSDEKVGNNLFISKHTVRSYRRNAVAKIHKLLSSFASYIREKKPNIFGVEMKELINFPSKVFFSGKRYDDTRWMKLNELVLRMEVDFEKLAVKFCEFGVFFKVSTRSHKYGLHKEIIY